MDGRSRSVGMRSFRHFRRNPTDSRNPHQFIGPSGFPVWRWRALAVQSKTNHCQSGRSEESHPFFDAARFFAALRMTVVGSRPGRYSRCGRIRLLRLHQRHQLISAAPQPCSKPMSAWRFWLAASGASPTLRSACRCHGFHHHHSRHQQLGALVAWRDRDHCGTETLSHATGENEFALRHDFQQAPAVGKKVGLPANA